MQGENKGSEFVTVLDTIKGFQPSERSANTGISHLAFRLSASKFKANNIKVRYRTVWLSEPTAVSL